MDWSPEGRQLASDFLGKLEPETVLVEFEGLRSFTARDCQGELLFAHQCGETEQVWRYAVVPFSQAQLDELMKGRLDLLAALSQPRFWIADIDNQGAVVACYSSSIDQIPAECRPQPGAMLLPEHEPLLSLRALGPHVSIGEATLGVLREQLDSLRTGLRYLAEAATGAFTTTGPPPKQVRTYYDLPAMLFAGSVQVNVYPPADPQRDLFEWDETWGKMASLLAWGLRQSSGAGDADQQIALEPEAKKAAIKAVYALAPPARGAVHETELSGRLLTALPATFRMNREVRYRLNARLHAVERQPAEISVVRVQGFITELDLEEGTCLLRDAAGNTLKKLVFLHNLEIADESLFENVKAAFDESYLVVIEAIQYGTADEVLLVSVHPETSQATPESDQA